MPNDPERRFEQAFGQMMDTIGEVKFELAKNRESHEDTRQFVREITRRNEVVHREIVQEIRDLRAETQASTREILGRLPPAA